MNHTAIPINRVNTGRGKAAEEQQMHFPALELAKVAQVDIGENLILLCQTLYSRKDINATTQTAAERLYSRELCISTSRLCTNTVAVRLLYLCDEITIL